MFFSRGRTEQLRGWGLESGPPRYDLALPLTGWPWVRQPAKPQFAYHWNERNNPTHRVAVLRRFNYITLNTLHSTWYIEDAQQMLANFAPHPNQLLGYRFFSSRHCLGLQEGPFWLSVGIWVSSGSSPMNDCSARVSPASCSSPGPQDDSFEPCPRMGVQWRMIEFIEL